MYSKPLIKYLPLLVFLAGIFYFRESSAKLYWFADELELIKEVFERGFWNSAVYPFAEGVVPFFRVIWSSWALLNRGEYLPMVIALWVIHALNIFLFTAILERARFSVFASLIATLTAAVAWSNVDLLTISYHFNSGLSCALYLGMFLLLLTARSRGRTSLAMVAVYGFLSFAAALTFQRAFAFGVSLLALIYLGTLNRKRMLSALTAAPLALEVSLSIYCGSGIGNRASLWQLENIYQAMRFAFYFYSANPLFHLLRLPGWLTTSDWSIIAFFALKVALVATVLVSQRKKGDEKTLVLITLCFFDIAHAALVGVGRFSEPLNSSRAYRYQFATLIAFTPFLGIAFDTALEKMKLSTKGAVLLAVPVTLALFVWISLPWRVNMRAHAFWQGKQSRRILDAQPGTALTDRDATWNGVPPTMNLEQARWTISKLKREGGSTDNVRHQGNSVPG